MVVRVSMEMPDDSTEESVTLWRHLVASMQARTHIVESTFASALGEARCRRRATSAPPASAPGASGSLGPRLADVVPRFTHTSITDLPNLPTGERPAAEQEVDDYGIPAEMSLEWWEISVSHDDDDTFRRSVRGKGAISGRELTRRAALALNREPDTDETLILTAHVLMQMAPVVAQETDLYSAERMNRFQHGRLVAWPR